MDPTLWSYQDASAVKAVAGFSAVAKKDGVRQRKLLMQVATNYCWRPAVDRSNLGMLGGAALTAAHTDAAELHFAAWDQSNAFTAVRTPQWMWGWTAAPPLRALDIWNKRSVKVRRTVGRMGWAYPLYSRLVMGSSRSVHVLRSINIQAAGQTLHSYSRLGSFKPRCATTSDDDLRSEYSERSTAVPSTTGSLLTGSATSGKISTRWWSRTRTRRGARPEMSFWPEDRRL